MNHYTSLEQSKKLLELGLNPETADFEYKCVGYTMHTTRPIDNFKYKVMLKEQNILHEPKYDIPCWSLGALLDVMPAGCSLRSRKGFTADKKIYFCTCPFNNDDPINYNSSIEAAYSMVVWLLENGYININ